MHVPKYSLCRHPTPNLQEALHGPVEPAHEEHAHGEPMSHQAQAGAGTEPGRLHVPDEVNFEV